MAGIEIKENVHWIGVVDWALRDFHGYAMARKGTTYNAYLIRDTKTTLIDTVNSRYLEPFLENINRLTDPASIDYIVVNHVEPDHSGCLSRLVELVRPEKIFCTQMGKAFMISHYHREDWPYEVVKTGDSVSIGDKTLRFLELRMLHWPDNMGCYVQDDHLLISNDAFGQNWATGERFDDQVDFDELLSHMAHYFANIILPYSGRVLQTLEKLPELGWEIDMIAPSHGIIFRSRVPEVLEAYRTFAEQVAVSKAVIVYDTMWRSTERMASALADGLLKEGVRVKVFNMKTAHHSDVMADVLNAKAVLFGSPTHNNGVLPQISGMLRFMEGLKPQGKLGAAFGSYGWSGESVAHLSEAMKAMKMEVIDTLKIQNVPDADALQACRALGERVGKAVKKRLRG